MKNVPEVTEEVAVVETPVKLSEPQPESTPVVDVSPDRFTLEIENEKHYREFRRNEQLDDLAIRVMSLPNDTHTGEIKELAAKHLAKRFS